MKKKKYILLDLLNIRFRNRFNHEKLFLVRERGFNFEKNNLTYYSVQFYERS